MGEESAIQRMVANLLSNAVKYTLEEGGRVAVTLEGRGTPRGGLPSG